MTGNPSKPAFLQLCREEPFRLFFPCGILLGVSGVSLWPLFFSGIHKFYPGIMHARLMIEGFMSAFVIGFLGTAGPRLTGTPALSRAELWTFFLLLASAAGFHIGERDLPGDLLFCLLLVIFMVRMGGRFARRTELPPPSFALAAFGLVNAFAGTLLLMIGPSGGGFPRCMQLGGLLLYQGYMLCLVLGVGGFLLPRFLHLPAQIELSETRDFSTPWVRRALLAAGLGSVLVASFFVEAIGDSPRLAAAIRVAAAGFYLVSEIPLQRRSAAGSATIAHCVRSALVLLLLGLLLPVLVPGQRIAGLHLVFIGGFTLITFAVGTRVVLGHGGHGALFDRPLPFLRSAAILLVVAAALRVSGDFLPARRGTLLSVASYLWILGAGVWSWRILPKVRASVGTEG